MRPSTYCWTSVATLPASQYSSSATGTGNSRPPASTPAGRTHGSTPVTRAVRAAPGPEPASAPVTGARRRASRAVRCVASAASTASGTTTAATVAGATAAPPNEASWSWGIDIHADSGAPNSCACRNDRTSSAPNA